MHIYMINEHLATVIGMPVVLIEGRPTIVPSHGSYVRIVIDETDDGWEAEVARYIYSVSGQTEWRDTRRFTYSDDGVFLREI